MNPENKRQGEYDFLRQSRSMLDDSVESLDAATLSKLNQARQRALAAQSQVSFLSSRRRIALASLSVVAISALLWMMLPQPSTPVHSEYAEIPIDDMEILMADTDMELLEDLEFVSWLLEESPGVDSAVNTDMNDAG